jgi:hypothetical protein
MMGRLASLLVLALSGCGGAPPASSAAPSEPASPTSNANEPRDEAAPVAAATAPYEVHEWGFVDVPLGGPAELGAGPGRPVPSISPPRPPSVRKPVLYFHLDPGAAPFDVAVAARIRHGRVLEEWPNVTQWPERTRTPDAVRWPAAQLAPCTAPLAPLAARLPPAMRGTCDAPDGYCELEDLGLYMTEEAACLTYRGVAARLLFYRGDVAAPALPLTAARDADGRSVVRSSVGAGAPMLFVRDGRGLELPWPTPGSDVALPEALSESFDGLRLARSLARMVSDAGLTAQETEAFMRAWSEPLFGVSVDGAARRDMPARDAPPRSARGTIGQPPFVLYVMPEATVPALAELELTPAPRVLRRVMVVRLELAM